MRARRHAFSRNGRNAPRRRNRQHLVLESFLRWNVMLQPEARSWTNSLMAQAESGLLFTRIAVVERDVAIASFSAANARSVYRAVLRLSSRTPLSELDASRVAQKVDLLRIALVELEARPLQRCRLG